MVDGDLFDKLARIGSILKKNLEPFGGIQAGLFCCPATHVECRITLFLVGDRYGGLFPAPTRHEGKRSAQIRIRSSTLEPGNQADI